MDRQHHASLLVGTPEEALSYLSKFSKASGVRLQGSPDFYPFRENVFGIEEARELKALSIRKTFSEGGKKIFFITPLRITSEAQNALLKTFEEPVEDTLFFLVVREEAGLLPTLLSRMSLVRVGGKSSDSLAEEFLKSSIKKRLAFTKKFVDAESSLPAFLDDILSFLKDSNADESVSIKRVYDVRRFAGDISASPRMILEHLALVL